MMKQKMARIHGEPPSISVLDQDNNMKTIKAGKDTLLLGATLQDNTTWQSHLETGDNALIPKIRRKLGVIKHIARDFTQEAKLLLINGYVMNQILYLIPLWSGTCEKYLQKLQVTLNNSARFVACKYR